MSQFTARYYEKRAFLALRPSNYFAGLLFSHLGPVRYIPHLGYMINDAGLTKSILKDSEHFSLNEAGGLGALIGEMWGDSPTLLSMDGKEHEQIKYALLSSFKEQPLLEVVGKEVENLAAKLSKKLSNGEEVDIARYIRISTIQVISKLLGVPETDEEELLKISTLTTQTMDCIDLKYKTYSKANRRKAEGYVEQFKTIAKHYYNSPKLRKNSLINQLKELGYSEEKAYGFIGMFLIAGTVTVSSTFPRLIALLTDTDSTQMLKDDASLLDSAIEEGLRYITPGPILLHGVKKTNELSGHEFKEGRRVIVLLYGILHNSKYTENAESFDINRQQNPEVQSLWFGVGPHFCMGSVLAKLEIKTLLTHLVKLDGELVIKRRRFMKKGIYPGYASLVIALRSND